MIQNPTNKKVTELDHYDPLYHQPIQLQKFLCLCDLHHSIIQQYKYSQLCTKKASVCKKGCPNAQKEHKFITNNHESISAKQFYSQFNKLRQSYFSMLTKMRDVTIPQFMTRIRVQLLELQRSMIQEINNNGLQLIQKLCRVNHKTVHKLMQIVKQPKIQQIQLSQLSCKDVYMLRQLAKILPAYEQTNSNNNDFLHAGFMKMLRVKGYLNLSNTTSNNNNKISNEKLLQNDNTFSNKKSDIPIVINIQDIRQLPGQLIKTLSNDSNYLNIINKPQQQSSTTSHKQQQQKQKHNIIQSKTKKKQIQQIQTLNIKIRSEMKQLIDDTNINYSKQSKISQLIKNDIQLSINCLQAYILRVKPSKLYLSLNIPFDNNIIVDTLVNTLNKCKSITNLIVYTMKSSNNNQSDNTVSYLQRQLNLYSEHINVTVSYNVQWFQQRDQRNHYNVQWFQQRDQRNDQKQQKQKQQQQPKPNIAQQLQTLIKLFEQ